MTNARNMDKDCQEYRERLGADPHTDAGAGHVQACAACRAWRDELRELDARIAAALAIDVPDLDMPDLPEIDTRNVAGLPARRRVRASWLAVAASLLVAVVIGLRLSGPDLADASLAEQIVAHIDHEPYALRASDRTVSDERLARVVPSSIAKLDPQQALVTYAQSCVINGHAVPHLVVQGEHGPVTILLMPDESIDGPQEIDSGGYRGVILPVGKGSVAIVGDDTGDLKKIEKTVLNSVAWST